MTGTETQPLRVEDLVGYFVDAETATEDFRVGTEHEKIGIFAETGQRVPYEGDRGIEVLLRRIADAEGWERVFEAEKVVALQKDGASITLEPGGQIELSGAPLRSARETCAEFNTHVDLVKTVSEDLGIAWLGLGSDPLSTGDEIPVVPKERYAIMRSYLPTRGKLALHMMHSTATVQANFDYEDERDMVSKFRTALVCSPIVTALFANSSLSHGRPNGFISRRAEIWRYTDPDRCGNLPIVFEPDFGYRAYTEWALDVPMFFVLRGDDYIPAKGMTFRHFLESGFEGHHAVLGDWDIHLTTLFPEVRLKRFLEVRGADAVPRGLTCALPALWKGILYDARAREEVGKLIGAGSPAERDARSIDVARLGLAAELAGRPVLELALELCQISARGLRRIAEREEIGTSEASFLDPLFQQIEIGKSPGQVILECWEGEWQRRLDRLIEYVRY